MATLTLNLRHEGPTVMVGARYRIPKVVKDLMSPKKRILPFLEDSMIDLGENAAEHCKEIMRKRIPRKSPGRGFRPVRKGGARPDGDPQHHLIGLIKPEFQIGDKWIKIGIAKRSELDTVCEKWSGGDLTVSRYPYWQYVEYGCPKIIGYRFLPVKAIKKKKYREDKYGKYGEGIMVKDSGGSHPGFPAVRMFFRTNAYIRKRAPIELRKAARKFKKWLKRHRG